MPLAPPVHSQCVGSLNLAYFGHTLSPTWFPFVHIINSPINMSAFGELERLCLALSCRRFHGSFKLLAASHWRHPILGCQASSYLVMNLWSETELSNSRESQSSRLYVVIRRKPQHPSPPSPILESPPYYPSSTP